MAITPQTNIRLLKVPFELDNKNQLTFADINSQTNYFITLPYIEEDYCSYQRKDNIIRFPAHIDNIINYNYVMYQNENYSNKWFYAYITNMKYVSDNMTEITIKTDVFQTWQFDLVYRKMFVEREHVNNDTIGLHTVPENLETGEYINQPAIITDLIHYLDTTYICIAVTELVMDTVLPPGNREYNGIFSGLTYLLFQNSQNATAYVNYVQSKAKTDAIFSIFLVPSTLISEADWTSYQEGGSTLFNYCFCPYSSSIKLMNGINIVKTNYLDEDFIPKNNKLLTYPYKCFNVTNFAGQTATYKYEYFENNECDLDLYGCISVGCSMKLIPSEYKGDIRNVEEGIDAGKLPVCNWTSDPYINWLTQNGTNLAVQTTLGIAKTIAGATISVASGGSLAPVGVMAGISGISDISQALHQVHENYIQPEQAHSGSNQGDFNFADGFGFGVQRKSIKQEYAKIIDDYFSMFRI